MKLDTDPRRPRLDVTIHGAHRIDVARDGRRIPLTLVEAIAVSNALIDCVERLEARRAAK